MGRITWRSALKVATDQTKDPFTDCTLSDEELDKEFDSGYGGSEGKDFTAWGETYVYFPVVYDGAEWVGWSLRNPCDTSTKHQGGE